MSTVKRLLTVAALTISVSLSGPASAGKERSTSLKVTATAYNSVSRQTDNTPDIAAWGDRLDPDTKSIAVSKDLMQQHGLSRGDKIRIMGLEGEYVVLDKMHSRWRKKIDIFMGKDQRKAKRWGKRTVTIHW